MISRSLLAGLVASLPFAASAQHLDQRTVETRTVLYYHADAAKIAALLPPGWTLLEIASGAAKGANLTINISDQLSATSADSKPGSDARGQAMTISARVKPPGSDENVAMVLFGLTSGVDVPGPYGRHHKAKVSLERVQQAEGTDGSMRVSETWDAQTPQGDGVHVDLHFTRGIALAGHVEQKTYSSAKPDFYRIYKIDNLQDVVLSSALNVHHDQHATVTSSGEPARLLAGAELVGVVSMPAFRREIWLP